MCITLILAFENPLFGAVFLDCAPPAKADELASGDVLDDPEVEDGEDEHHDVDEHDVAQEDVQQQVAHHGRQLEPEVQHAHRRLAGLAQELRRVLRCCPCATIVVVVKFD